MISNIDILQKLRLKQFWGRSCTKIIHTDSFLYLDKVSNEYVVTGESLDDN